MLDCQFRNDSGRRALGLPEIPLNRPRFQWFRGAALGGALLAAGLGANAPAADVGALDGGRHRVVVSTDIGGTDPDDFQSMVHLLLYADVLEIEGLISSPYGPGRLRDILTVIDHYEHDFPQLSRSFSDYPSPDYLRDISKQGAIQRAPYSGVGQPTEGSEWIIECARRSDPRPLHVLVWGGLEDLAQALRDAPDILPKLRVYWIGGPNKKWSPDAYQYILREHPNLWIIETNAAYRGWFTGGIQSDNWGNTRFVQENIAEHGALGTFFEQQLGGSIKMGDSPSVAWLLKGDPSDPSIGGWGGRFVRAWPRPYLKFDRPTTPEDRIEVFGILEISLAVDERHRVGAEAWLHVENQALPGHIATDGTIRFRFCPKATKVYKFEFKSNIPGLDGGAGGITAIHPTQKVVTAKSRSLPNWWTDNPAPELFERGHMGAKTVNEWRREYLSDFAERMKRLDPSKERSGILNNE